MDRLFVTALERGPAVRTGATEKRPRARPHSSHRPASRPLARLDSSYGGTNVWLLP